jgi:hypothetical protein
VVIDPPAPPVGSMVLYDAMLPPLLAGDYRVVVEDEVRRSTQQLPLEGQERFFRLDCPRFTLAPTEVAGVFPPRNAQGPFHRELPHVVLGRRSLPWERQLDPSGQIASPTPVMAMMPQRPRNGGGEGGGGGDGGGGTGGGGTGGGGTGTGGGTGGGGAGTGGGGTGGGPQEPEPLPSAGGRPPWLALLVFDEDEYTILRGVPLSQVVPADVLARLGATGETVCDAVEADLDLLRAIMPAREELQLLTHVRQVNVDDRELAAGDSDGWFAVVVANRLPAPGRRSCACLVSVEERADLIPADPPAVTWEPASGAETAGLPADGQAGGAQLVAVEAGRRGRDLDPAANVVDLAAAIADAGIRLPVTELMTRVDGVHAVDRPGRLVLLHAWQFTCEGDSSFRELAQRLDSAMIGTGHPGVADTGHIPMDLHDRAGATQVAWYRGPFAPHLLSRDQLGPYHSADQARRVAPDTGAEDLSLASAWELGRLLALSDGRFAQELMRWRRSVYEESVRASTIAAVTATVDPGPLLSPVVHEVLASTMAARAIGRLRAGAGPLADPWRTGPAKVAPGCDPETLRDAWQLDSVAHAEELLGGRPAGLGSPVEASATPEAAEGLSLDQVATDTTRLGQLHQARSQTLDNTDRQLGGPR